MIDWSATGLSCLMLFAGFVVSFTAYCLRDFSRSRLKEICLERNREERFGEILKNHESATVVSDLLMLLIVIASAMLWFLVIQPRSLETPAARAFWLATLAVTGAILLLGFLWVILPWTVSRVVGEVWLYRMWPIMSLGLRLTRGVLRFIHRFDPRYMLIASSSCLPNLLTAFAPVQSLIDFDPGD